MANKYITLSEAVKTDAGAKEDLISTQAELLEKLGLEGESIDDLIEKYGSLSNAIKQASIDSLKNSQLDLIAGVNAAKDELLDIGADGFFGDNNIINATGDDAVKAFKELEKAGVVSSGSYGSGGGSLVLIGDDTTTEGILENYQKLEDALNALRDSNAFVGGELTDNSLYQAIYARYDEMKEKVDAYKTSIGDLNENLAQQTMLTALQGSELPKSEQEFETFKQQLIDTAVASKQFIGSEKEIADSINSYLSKVPEFAEYFSLPLEDGAKNLDKMTVSLSELEGASNKIKTLGSAFKELSDDGYITIKTLGEIQTATGLSNDEWTEYENRLLKAKKGSADFNQVLSELTYKILENEFATIDLTNATDEEITAIENKIAATLRENGVENDNIIAKEYVNNLRAKSRIQAQIEKKGIDAVIEGLEDETNWCGLTKDAYTQLVAKEIIFNKNRLDVSEKLAQLQSIYGMLGLVGDKWEYLNNAMKGSTYVKSSAMIKAGIYKREGKDRQYEWVYDDVAYSTEEEALDAYIIDQVTKDIAATTPPIPDYSSVVKDSTSNKNKPNYEDPTEAIINRINLRADELAQQEEEIQNLIDLAELENDYEKQLSLTNDLITTRKNRLTELETANVGLHNEAEYLRNNNPWKEEEWFDSQGNATEAYYNLLNSANTKEEQEAIKDLFEKLSKYKEAYKDNTEGILDINKQIIEDEETLSELHSSIHERKIRDIEHEIEMAFSKDPNADVSSYYEQLQEEYHKEAERLRELDPEKYKEEIQELQQKWWDAEESKQDNFKTRHENTIRDIEHEMALVLEANPFADTTSYYKQMQTLYHQEAERLRALDPEKYKEEIQELQQKWWDAQNAIVDWRWENSQNWINDRNTYNDWALFDDSEIEAWERVVKWLKEEYPNDLDKIKEAEQNLFEARKKEFDKANDFGNTYLESRKTLLQSYYDITNSIAEAQQEINKELETSKTMYEWLDEDTRKLLFNQEDYNTLSEELFDIQYAAQKLQRQYERDLNNSSLETIESITSQYQMQYETLMKSYEIAKADLEIAKKKQKLNKVLNERNVRMFINGQWQWVANTEDVINAKSELADAEYAKRVEESGLTQQESINNLTRQQDELSVVIKKFEIGVIDLTSAIAMAKNAIGNMPSSLSSMYSNSLPSSSSQTSSNKSSSGSSVKSSSSGGLTLKVGADGNAPAGARVGDIIETAGGNYKIVTAGTEGANYNTASGHWSIRIDEEHAKGTRYTPGGMTLMGEDGFETYINSDGHLIPINQPTIGNIASGGIVFNTDQMKSLRTLWDMSNLNIGGGQSLLYGSQPQQIDQSQDNRIIINGMTVDSGSSDGQVLISALRRYVGNH